MSDDFTHVTPKTKCPSCGSPNDRSTAMTPSTTRPPKPGDVCFCFKCGSLALYTEDLSLRSPSMVETAALMQHPEIVRGLDAWRTMYGGATQ